MNFPRHWNAFWGWYFLKFGTEKQKKRYKGFIYREVFHKRTVTSLNKLFASEKRRYGHVHDGNLASTFVGYIHPNWRERLDALEKVSYTEVKVRLDELERRLKDDD